MKWVITPKSNKRQEDARREFDAIPFFNVVPAVGFGNVTIGTVKIPLTASRAGIVSRSRECIHSELRHEARLHVVVVEVAAHSKLRDLELIVAKDLGQAGDRVFLRPV